MSEMFTRRHLPHYDVGCGTYFVTACLAGSIPSLGLLSLRRHADAQKLQPPPRGVSLRDWHRMCSREAFEAGEAWLDRRPAVQWLKDRRLAAIVREELLRLDGDWYDLHAFVVMPSHVHCVFTPRAEWVRRRSREARWPGSPRSIIVQKVKGSCARACNHALGREGLFWQHESYDRIVRDAEEFERIVHYVERNPVKAGLCQQPEEWEFSSARQRAGKQRVPEGFLTS